MSYQQHDLQQGTEAWHAFRATHYGASEAAAMLGLSKYTSRNELLRQKATGISAEVDARTQAIFDRGHETEKLARPIIEAKIGEQLSPVTLSKGKLSCSCDGLTFDDSAAWEHKQWNANLAHSIAEGILPESHQPQCQQVLMITGADKLIFTVSDGTLDKMVSMDVLPDTAWFERIVSGWDQFEKDLENYQHIEHIEKPKAEVCIELPALFVHAKGEITEHNMEAFGNALTAKLAEVRAIALITDQDFSNAKAAAKMFRDKAKEIALSKEAMLSQTVTIGEAARMMDAWRLDLNATALQLEKDVEREDLAKKRVMVGEAGIAFSAHVEALEAETRPIQLNVPRPDFAVAIKNKRTYASMQGALDDALAQGKIEADAIAKDIRTKLIWYFDNANCTGFGFLFRDLDRVIQKPFDDFTLTVKSRIAEHQQAEAAKLAAKLAAERTKMEAEVKAKVEEESKATAKAKAENDARIDAMVAQKRAEIEADGQEGLVRLANQVAKPKDSKQFRPTRLEMIMSVSDSWGVPKSEAEIWLRDEFSLQP